MTTPLVTSPVTIFLIVLAIILSAPVIFNRLKIPHIIGMIVAGVVVGPYGFNILDRDSSFNIFGQVGLLYLMFLAGLEIDMYHLRLNLKRGVVFGLLTFFIPMVMGVLTSVYVLKLSWLCSFLLASMFASHTLIAYPVAVRYGVTKSPAVLISIVGTIIAVIGALLVLAGVVNVHATGELDFSEFMGLAARLGIYCIAILYLYPRITRWFFKRYSDRVTQYVYVLMMVFLSAWLSALIGLEPVLGAFFAGLVLNRYIPSDSSLMNNIEFVGNALFIPYFLIGVGMLINLRVIFSGGTMLVSLIMLAVALASKWLAAYGAQKAYHMQPCDCRMMFGLTTAHTAVALAVVTIGYNMMLPDGSRLISESVLNGTVLVILITCALAPLFTSEAAAKIKIRQLAESEPAADEKKVRENALIPVSNPLTVSQLVELTTLMRRHTSGMETDRLYALHVRNDNTPAARAVGEHALKLASEAAAASNISLETIERFDFNTVTGIVNTVQERYITRIVIGMHRKTTVIDTFLGAKIDQLLNSTSCMVMIARCFIPVNTVTRIVVWVPRKAEYESGFQQWVLALTQLASQVGCRLLLYSHSEQQPILRGIIRNSGIGIRLELPTISNDDDLVLLSGNVLDDDLFVIVGARPNSVSYATDMAEIPGFLQRNFSRNNLCIIYPDQAGTAQTPPSFTDPLGTDIVTTASPLWLAVRARLSRLNQLKKQFTHRYRKKRRSNNS